MEIHGTCRNEQSSVGWQRDALLNISFIVFHCRFTKRSDTLGPIPTSGDHDKASTLYAKYKAKFANGKTEKLREIADEMWDTFVVNTTWPSSVLAAFPPKEEYGEMESLGLKAMKRKNQSR